MIFEKLKIETKDIIMELEFKSIASLIRFLCNNKKKSVQSICYIIYWDIDSTKKL